MASDPDAPPPLQFDTVTPSGADPAAGTAAEGVTCAACQQTIADEYFDVNGQSVCEGCRDRLARHADVPRGWSVLARAVVFGIAAAFAGAILYYAVIAITDFEIGIVAIAIGYMVGYAVRTAAKGRGGRRFQVVAILLTYWAVGLAYTPLVFQSIASEQASQAAAAGDDAVTADADADASGQLNVPLAFAFLLGLSFALPVLTVAGSLPGGLLSAAIIAFGMHQAWRMTGVPQLSITGPYRIGVAPAGSV